jgi:hypothetical protein
MLKKIILLIFLFSTFGSYKLYKSYQIPFNTTHCQDNWIKYSNDEVQFEFPHKLSVYQIDKIANLSSFSDTKHEVFYIYKGLASGMRSIHEILAQKKPKYLSNEILNSLKIIIPDQNEDFYANLFKDPSRFEMIETIALDSLNFQYAYKIKVGIDTFLCPIEIDPFELERLKTHSFFLDTIDNCFRKIYFNSINPSKYAVCYLGDVNSESFKHAIIQLSEIDSLNKDETIHLSKENIIRFLKSFRLNKKQ